MKATRQAKQNQRSDRVVPIGGAQKPSLPSSLILKRRCQVIINLPAGARVGAILRRAIDQVTEAVGGLEPRLTVIARKWWTRRSRLSYTRGKQNVRSHQQDRNHDDRSDLLHRDLHGYNLY